MRGCQLGGKGERECELGTTCSLHQPKLLARNTSYNQVPAVSAKFHVCKGVALIMPSIRVRAPSGEAGKCKADPIDLTKH